MGSHNQHEEDQSAAWDTASRTAEPVIMLRSEQLEWCLISNTWAVYSPQTAHWMLR